MNKILTRSLAVSFFTISMSVFPLVTFADPISELQAGYQSKGAAEFNPARGAKLWKKNFVDDKSGKNRNCDSCHTKAGSGSFSESGIIIPGYGRWEDD